MSKLTCPKCGKDAHPVCGNPDCTCRKGIPKGEKPLIYRPMLGYFVIPEFLFQRLWHTFQRPHKLGLYELEECPYCGFRMLFDGWAEREMEQAFGDEPVSKELREMKNEG